MSKILISGLINYETTVRVDGFPIKYCPSRYPFFGINGTISGVGYNLAKALSILGDEVDFFSMIGKDDLGKLVTEEMSRLGISTDHILPQLAQTPRSVILYDITGKRCINVDLKDIQEQSYPFEVFEAAIETCDIAALCNINFSRPFLAMALQKGKLIATDVHAISDPDDEYDRDFMTYAHILFMSDENLPGSPEDWVIQVVDRYGPEIAVVGLGSQGVLLSVRSDNFMERLPSVYTREIVNTIGAGDALFSAFLHYYAKTRNPYESIKKAIVFASYKIGEAGAADGFLDENSLEELYGEFRSVLD